MKERSEVRSEGRNNVLVGVFCLGKRERRHDSSFIQMIDENMKIGYVDGASALGIPVFNLRSEVDLIIFGTGDCTILFEDYFWQNWLKLFSTVAHCLTVTSVMSS